MDAGIWQIISIAGYSLAGLLFVAAVFMFFKLNIPAIIGDLSGRTAAKQIREIREQNAKSGRKVFQPDAFNLERGELTEKVASKSLRLRKSLTSSIGSKKLDKKGQTVEASIPNTVSPPTDVLPESMGIEQDVHQETAAALYGSDGTVVLFSDNEVPAENRVSSFTWGARVGETEESGALGTTVLAEANGSMAGTTVLAAVEEPAIAETTVLAANEESMAATTVLAGAENGIGAAAILAGVGSGASETTILAVANSGAAETTILADAAGGMAATTILAEVQYRSEAGPVPGGNLGLASDTSVLFQEEGTEGTTVLAATTVLEEDEAKLRPVAFRVVKDITIIHTDEVL